VIVTDNLQQATRAANATATALMLDWELVEHGPTTGMFTNPKDERDVSGRFG
jgi:phosphate transport system ATP-binding protein